jgi:hypothetical protein
MGIIRLGENGFVGDGHPSFTHWDTVLAPRGIGGRRAKSEVAQMVGEELRAPLVFSPLLTVAR